MSDVVLVHGAFHGPWCWDRVAGALRARDVDVVSVELPFTGFDDDVAVTRAAVEDAGPGAVVCCHSYGGVVTDRAVAGIGGIARVVYLAALISSGEDLFAEPWPIMDAIVADGSAVRFDPARARDVFYADSDEDTVAWCRDRLRSMILNPDAFLSPPTSRPSAPSTYVVCTADGAVPPALQRRLATGCDEHVEWPTDHSPFLTRPTELATLLAPTAR